MSTLIIVIVVNILLPLKSFGLFVFFMLCFILNIVKNGNKKIIMLIQNINFIWLGLFITKGIPVIDKINKTNEMFEYVLIFLYIVFISSFLKHSKILCLANRNQKQNWKISKPNNCI